MTKLTTPLVRAGAAFAIALLTVPGTLHAGQGAAFDRSGAIVAGPERLYQASVGAAVDPSALRCLTEALYFEARGEPLSGQRAVAEVIMNRVDHPAFPKSVCGVVNQQGQFSYKGRSLRMRDGAAASRARRVAAELLAGAPRSLTSGATYFHTTYVRPSWTHRFTRTARIGSHVFYRRGGARIAAN